MSILDTYYQTAEHVDYKEKEKTCKVECEEGDGGVVVEREEEIAHFYSFCRHVNFGVERLSLLCDKLSHSPKKSCFPCIQSK